MFDVLKKEFMIINMLLIFFVLCGALLGFYAVTWFSAEQATNRSLSSYMSIPINEIRHDKQNARLFISEVDSATYDYIRPLVDSNVFKYFHTSYMHDSFSSSQTNNILSYVLRNSDFAANIAVDGRYYRYMKQKTDSNMVKIVVLDITSGIKHLHSTAISLVVIALISLGIIYFISRFIAERSVKPIEVMFERQNEFFSDISHELKTPLTVAITNLAVIESHKEETVESQEKWIGFLKDQLDRLSNLFNEMLFLEDMRSGHPLRQSERINFSALVDYHLKSVEPLIGQKGIQLQASIQESLYVFADLEAMTRLVTVLVDNAIKYTPEGGVIDLCLAQSAKKLVLLIENSGEGIEAEHVDRIFDRMYRVTKSRSRNEGGKGLGLAIAKSVVEYYGGSISVESRVGEQTSFRVVLPVSA